MALGNDKTSEKLRKPPKYCKNLLQMVCLHMPLTNDPI